jgi:hypothetical protein
MMHVLRAVHHSVVVIQHQTFVFQPVHPQFFPSAVMHVPVGDADLGVPLQFMQQYFSKYNTKAAAFATVCIIYPYLP